METLMNKHDPMTYVWVVLALIAAIVVAIIMLLSSGSLHRAYAQGTQTFRDNAGRQIGTATTNSGGITTFRDPAGRQTGTATTNSSGTTTFRDSAGRQIGTTERRLK